MCTTERARGGFTLIELLVSLVLAGFLAGVIFQLIEGQGRFVSTQSAREEVQQNTRGALELITSELRAVPPGGIVSATSNSIVFRLPRAWGVLCDAPVQTGGTMGVVFAPGTFPPDYPGGTLSSEAAQEWGVAVPAGSAGEPDAYVAAALTASSLADGSCPLNLNVSRAQGKDIRQFDYSGFSGASSSPDETAVFLFQRVAYDATTSSVPGVWLRRRTGNASAQPVAGPLLAADGASSSPDGLVFTYYCRDAAGSYRALTDVEMATASNLLRVDRVKVKVAMQSRNRISGGGGQGSREQQQDSMTVHLRNRLGAATCP